MKALFDTNVVLDVALVSRFHCRFTASQEGGLLLEDLGSTNGTFVNDKRVELTSFEYRILEYLIHRAGEVISKTELTERLYAQDFDRDSNTIEVFVTRIRKKLEKEHRQEPAGRAKVPAI